MKEFINFWDTFGSPLYDLSFLCFNFLRESLTEAGHKLLFGSFDGGAVHLNHFINFLIVPKIRSLFILR